MTQGLNLDQKLLKIKGNHQDISQGPDLDLDLQTSIGRVGGQEAVHILRNPNLDHAGLDHVEHDLGPGHETSTGVKRIITNDIKDHIVLQVQGHVLGLEENLLVQRRPERVPPLEEKLLPVTFLRSAVDGIVQKKRKVVGALQRLDLNCYQSHK